MMSKCVTKWTYLNSILSSEGIMGLYELLKSLQTCDQFGMAL